VVTEFDEIFLGYQLHQVSVLNQCFKDHLDHQGSDDDDDDDDDGDGPQNVSSVQTSDTADSRRRFHQM
jgi:hypothetical protein